MVEENIVCQQLQKTSREKVCRTKVVRVNLGKFEIRWYILYIPKNCLLLHQWKCMFLNFASFE